ncbi:dihydrouridine synthase-like protein [Cercophora scortea]|uniref:tRNA-dihydrouridine(16/17) synthase [NAD(P)(+)] n=1 Tax=Cercophora scortea TaxID=314031 RepID=A0AAE0MIP1_9PEZI|nr:dihydrouridine synthase-like protein [Cercophora scortea]
MASSAGVQSSDAPPPLSPRKKLHGRAFYESIGSPKFIVAPMVDQSEFAWRMLSRSFLPESQRASLLAYSPMLHARHFASSQKYRDTHFQPTRVPLTDTVHPLSNPLPPPFLDGNPSLDRPLFVQFCANDPSSLAAAAQLVAPYCDAVDLNLGCPQGIARKGHYGAFLQEDQALIFSLIRTLHEQLPIPVTAKIRLLETKEASLAYARNVLAAGASILTVHGRRREQKGHLTGLADWAMIRYLRDNLPPETVLFANGNILQHGDLEKCLEATGADGVMSAEGNLSDPGIFAEPPDVGDEGREYWRGRDGRGGWRVDAVFRRYMDILHRLVLEQDPPVRRELFMVGDDTAWIDAAEAGEEGDGQPPAKKRKHDGGGGSGSGVGVGGGGKSEKGVSSPNFVAVQAHLFHMLRHFVSRHTDVRDRLGRARMGDISTYEAILAMVERRVAQGLLEYERTDGKSVEDTKEVEVQEGEEEEEDDPESSVRAVRECKRPWWVIQPIIRPLPKEALAKGAVQVKKQKAVKGPVESGKRKAEAEGEVVVEAGDGSGHAATEALETTVSYPQSQLVSG